MTTFDRSKLTPFTTVDTAAAFREYQGVGVDIDPYETFDRLRNEGDVVRGSMHDVFGVDHAVAITIGSAGYRDVPAARMFSALSHAAVTAILRDADGFDNSAILKAHLPFLGKTISSMDGAEHRRSRGLISTAFSRPSVTHWNDTVVAENARRGVEHVMDVARSSGGMADLLGDFVADYPANVIIEILGLPDSDIEAFISTAMAMVTFSDFERASEAAAVMIEWITTLADAARERPPTRDLISQLVHVEVDGDRLTDEEVAAFVRILFVAGFETTVQGFSNTLVGLLTTGQWADVRDDRSLVRAAIDEGLRWQTSVLGMPRVATRDHDLFGVHIPTGSVVLCFSAAANHDPARWDRPGTFDVHREGLSNVAFGSGPHLCVGMPLARAEIAAGLNLLLDTVPNVRLVDADADAIRIRGLAGRGPAAIPVVVSGLSSGTPT